MKQVFIRIWSDFPFPNVPNAIFQPESWGSVTENTSVCIIPDVRIDENTARNWKLTLNEAISRLLT